MSFTPAQISQACQVPLAAAEANWPILLAALHAIGLSGRAIEIAVAANVAEETAHTFEPIEEYGNEAYWRGELGDQWWYHGRGFNQRTWLDAYRGDGAILGLDLVNHPELLLEPVNSARDTALFVQQKGIPALAAAGNWYGVREAWNGGLNGIDSVMAHVNALLALPYAPDAPAAPVTYRVIAPCALKTFPNHICPAAHDAMRLPVHLKPGDQVVATGAETPHWRHVHLPGAMAAIHGWLLKDNLR